MHKFICAARIKYVKIRKIGIDIRISTYYNIVRIRKGGIRYANDIEADGKAS